MDTQSTATLVHMRQALAKVSLINPRHACGKRVTVLVRSVCLGLGSVLPQSATCIIYTSKTRYHRFFAVFSTFCYVIFTENVSFESYGVISGHRGLPHSLASF